MNLITCISTNKNAHNPFDKITHIGGNNSKGGFLISSDKTVNLVESGEYRFFVRLDGKLEKIVVGVYEGKKYLKTVSDKFVPSTLLSLQECN